MKELVFLLEEPSAKAMLESLLPRILDDAVKFRCIPFEGKQDLDKNLAKKIRGYQNDQARFIVLRDQDSHPDCKALKADLLRRCGESGKLGQCVVRLACTELEAFYLADLQAVERALSITGLAKQQLSQKFRAPDHMGSPSTELKILTKRRFEKIRGSRVIGLHLNVDNERSPSFRNLIAAIRRLERELLNQVA
jgi:Domain of unknown function (DUF4276)